MGFFATFVVLLTIFIGVAWYFGDDSPEVKRSVLYYPFDGEQQIESVQNCPVSSSPLITLSAINGALKITGHPHNNVVIQVTKRGDRKQFEQVQAKVNATKTHVDITTYYKSRYSHNISIDYEIIVPHNTQCKLLKTKNGSISVFNVYGPIHCETANGSITLEQTKNSVKAHTVNGTIIANIATFKKDFLVELATVNGTIECKLPENISADIYAKTSIGKIKTNIPLTLNVGFVSGEELSGHVGTRNSGRISLKTSNGAIAIQSADSALA